MGAWISAFGQWLYNWQTLVGAVLALVAAYAAIKVTRSQIAQAANFNREQIDRAHNAARVILPLALDEIGVACQGISNVLITELERRLGRDALAAELLREHQGEFVLPRVQVSPEALSALQGFVATLKLQRDVRHMAELISHLQIFLVRYRGFDINQVAAEETMFNLLIDAGKVRLLADNVFNYARFVDEESFGIVGSMPVEEAWDNILRSTYGLIFHVKEIDVLSKPLAERIRRHKEQATSPWNEKFEAW